jgi:uncharacterized repeat protein (TIGR03803 family)
VVAAGTAAAAPTETVFHFFAGGASDGRQPSVDLRADGFGNFYGTTYFGGLPNVGVVFKLSPGRTSTVLHSFCVNPLAGCPDGRSPSSALIADGAGNLYGTTLYGGNGGGSAWLGFRCGVVFKLSPGGTYTVLHSFAGGTSDGTGPSAGLIADSSGNLYGTTGRGGAFGQGVVFKLSPGGTLTVSTAISAAAKSLRCHREPSDS